MSGEGDLTNDNVAMYNQIWERMTGEDLHNVHTFSEVNEKLQQSGHYALLVENYMTMDILTENIKNLNLISSLTIGSLPTGLVYPKGSPYKSMFDKGDTSRKYKRLLRTVLYMH